MLFVFGQVRLAVFRAMSKYFSGAKMSTACLSG